jgi:hypothetical protein
MLVRPIQVVAEVGAVGPALQLAPLGAQAGFPAGAVAAELQAVVMERKAAPVARAELS